MSCVVELEVAEGDGERVATDSKMDIKEDWKLEVPIKEQWELLLCGWTEIPDATGQQKLKLIFNDEIKLLILL